MPTGGRGTRRKEAAGRPIWGSPTHPTTKSNHSRPPPKTNELCTSTKDIEVHHLRKLADLKGKGGRERPAWVKLMAARQRKTLVVCRFCHRKIHAGQPL